MKAKYFLCTTVLFARMVMAEPAIVSVNLVAGDQNASLAAHEIAGVVPATNWNNFVGNAAGTAWTNATLSNLLLQDGTVTSIQIHYQSLSTNGVNYLGAGIFDNSEINDAAYPDADHKLMDDFLHQFGANRYVKFTVTNIPEALTENGYDLIVYISSGGPAVSRRGRYLLDEGATGNGLNDFDHQIYAFQNGNTFTGAYVNAGASSTAAGAGSGNYIRFAGLSADSFVLYGHGNDLTNTDNNRSAVNGFQLVAETNIVQIISVNVSATPLSALEPAEVAGIVQGANWNNLVGSGVQGALASGTLTGLTDEKGVATGAELSYAFSATHWTLRHGGGANLFFPDASSKLMRDFVTPFGESRFATYTFNQVPPSLRQQGYNLIVYIAAGYQGETPILAEYTLDGSQTIVAQQNLNLYYDHTTGAQPGFIHAGNASTPAEVALNSGGNYIVFSNLTAASFTLDVRGVDYAETDRNRAAINGFQLVAVGVGREIFEQWATENIFNSLTNRTDDASGDGLTNEEVWVLDLDPMALNTPFSLDQFAAGPVWNLGFFSSSRRWYSVEYTDDLTDALSWRVVPGRLNVQGAGGLDLLTVEKDEDATQLFYRVLVRVPQY